MIAAVVVALAMVVLLRTLRRSETGTVPNLAPRRTSPQLAAAITYAERLFLDKRWIAAEKAYLDVLKLDHKNLAAYSHLGIIYSTQKNQADAIECFEIAVRLKPSASTYQNIAMAYYENRNFMKSVSAYEKALMFETSAPRYVGLSKAYRKISNSQQVIASLERAYELDQSERVRTLLITAYEEGGRAEEARGLATGALSASSLTSPLTKPDQIKP